ncbi:MAG TPA: dihydrolipoamide acetyltransferase family protein [Gammaproteobacteria bacterium]|nr:dihydrolipoamide acetyltransferase family protein [Gammaproteobacteria bacterium]
MNVFNLPDLGEGLPDAEIVRWFVKVGDVVEAEQPLAEMETAKAVVEVPSPQSGRIAILHGKPGDVVETGKPLVTFGNAEEFRSLTAKEQSDEDDIPKITTLPSAAQAALSQASTPVQALARKLKVDLTTVQGSGQGNSITLADVRKAADTARIQNNGISSNDEEQTAVAIDFGKGVRAAPKVRSAASAHGIDMRNLRPTGHQDNVTLADVQKKRVQQPETRMAATGSYKLPERTQEVTGKPVPIRGERRSMALNMAKARDTIVNTTVYDMADISAWPEKQDISARLIRAVCAASMVEPALNAWFDGEKMERTLLQHVNVAIAVDSSHGLSVPVIHNADTKTAQELRASLNELREAVYAKRLKPEQLQNATITLSNFGMIAGTFATPIVTPPQVAIVGTGRIMQELRLTASGIVNVRHIPVSLSFDHRAVTGGDAVRFLAAFIADLGLPY